MIDEEYDEEVVEEVRPVRKEKSIFDETPGIFESTEEVWS